MLRRNFLKRNRTVPNLGTSKSIPIQTNFSKGMVTYLPNDERPRDALELLQDTRQASIGNYKTRKGCDFYSVPIGEALNAQNLFTTGAADQTFSSTRHHAMKLTATADGRATHAQVRLKNDASATGTVIVSIHSDSSGSPGTLLARSSIAQNLITSSYAYYTARFIAAPTIVNTSSYWIVVSVQGGSGLYKISSTTSSTNAKVSTDTGQSWSGTAYSLNVALYTSTSGGTKGYKRITRSTGTDYSFIAHGSNLYTISDVDGSTTSVDSGIDASSTFVRFEFVNDVLYYVDGLSKPRKYNFTASSEVSAAPSEAYSIIEHVGILFYIDAADRNKVFYSNFGDYETFTSTDFIYVPAPKKSDWSTAFAKLNGVLYIFTDDNKFNLFGQDNATFRLDEAIDQGGTYTQESVDWDENYIYYANDDGVHQFNGTSSRNLTFNKGFGIQDKWDALTQKRGTIVKVSNNRLYVWYTPNAASENRECFVYNLLTETWESLDTATYIGRAETADHFYQASNLVGAVYYAEESTNDYNNLGEIMKTELKTHYDPFGKPQQKKRIRKWRPDFQSASGDYSVQAGFAADYSDDTTFYDIALQGEGYTYDDPASLYDTATYAQSGEIHSTSQEIYGSAYRWQRIYKHHAAREPIEFAGETLQVETQRMR